MLAQLLALALVLVVIGMVLGFSGLLPVALAGSIAFVLGGAILALALLVGLLLIVRGLLFGGDRPRWGRLN